MGLSGTGLAEAEPTASEAEIFRAAVVATATPSEEVPGDTAGPMLAPVVAEAPQAWDLAAEAGHLVVAAVVGGADKRSTQRIADTGTDNEIIICE